MTRNPVLTWWRQSVGFHEEMRRIHKDLSVTGKFRFVAEVSLRAFLAWLCTVLATLCAVLVLEHLRLSEGIILPRHYARQIVFILGIGTGVAAILYLLSPQNMLAVLKKIAARREP